MWEKSKDSVGAFVQAYRATTALALALRDLFTTAAALARLGDQMAYSAWFHQAHPLVIDYLEAVEELRRTFAVIPRPEHLSGAAPEQVERNAAVVRLHDAAQSRHQLLLERLAELPEFGQLPLGWYRSPR